ncbi:hypothetical protein AB6A23_22940 [Paenibacillus tarimensis]
MNNLWKKLLLTAALTVIAASITAAAPAPSAEPRGDEASGRTLQHAGSDLNKRGGRHWKHSGMGGWITGNGVHQRMYITLLVEKYDPQSQKDWTPVLQESARLRNEMKALAKSPDKDKNQIWKDKDFLNRLMKSREKHKDVYKQFHEAVKSQDGGKIKAALSNLLPVYREQNSMLENVLTKLKQQTSAIGPEVRDYHRIV